MRIINQSSYKASPYWRWWNYNVSTFPPQFLPKRDYNDILKKASESS
jgi:hypothetical protein